MALCYKYMEGRSGNRCFASHRNPIHIDKNRVGYHTFVEEEECDYIPRTFAERGVAFLDGYFELCSKYGVQLVYEGCGCHHAVLEDDDSYDWGFVPTPEQFLKNLSRSKREADEYLERRRQEERKEAERRANEPPEIQCLYDGEPAIPDEVIEAARTAIHGQRTLNNKCFECRVFARNALLAAYKAGWGGMRK